MQALGLVQKKKTILVEISFKKIPKCEKLGLGPYSVQSERKQESSWLSVQTRGPSPHAPPLSYAPAFNLLATPVKEVLPSLEQRPGM